VDERSLAAGVAVSLPFTLSIALLCTTSGADRFYAPLAAVTMAVVFLVAMGLQVACGVRAFRGAPLLRPMWTTTASFTAGAVAVFLVADMIVRVSGVKGAALPQGLDGAAVQWFGLLVQMASVPAMSALVVIVGVAAARRRLRAG
jgi:hypothetical protein